MAFDFPGDFGPVPPSFLTRDLLLYHLTRYHYGRFHIRERVYYPRSPYWERRPRGGIRHRFQRFRCGLSRAEARVGKTWFNKSATRFGRCYYSYPRNDSTAMESVCQLLYQNHRWSLLCVPLLISDTVNSCAKIISKCSKHAQHFPSKVYLIWYHKGHPRAQRLNTYETVWKTLRQLYYDVCHKPVANDVGKEITNVSDFESCPPSSSSDYIQYLHG